MASLPGWGRWRTFCLKTIFPKVLTANVALVASQRGSFEGFFFEMTGHRPYLWLVQVAEALRRGDPPRTLTVPTGYGKTSVLLAWLWALAQDLGRPSGQQRTVPMRYVLVVDRRVVVDDTVASAERWIDKLKRAETPAVAAVADALRLGGDSAEAHVESEPPLVSLSILRGGLSVRPQIAAHPAAPGIVVGTVDLVGSTLLGRSYVGSVGRRPIDMALLGTDSLLVLDEAHLSGQLDRTLQVLERQQQDEGCLGGAIPQRRVMRMTATPSAGDAGLQFDRVAEIRSQPEVGDRIRRRAEVPVAVEHVEASTGDQGMARAVSGLTVEPGQSYLVFANTPQRAKTLASTLRSRHRDADIVLLVGGMPNTFQRRVLRRLASVRTGERRRGPDENALIVVATQTLEVGADLDFDHLLTPIASAAALTQRLGRVNRVGSRSGGSVRIIVGEGKPEPVYGTAAADLGSALLAAAPTTVSALIRVLESPEHAAAPGAAAVLPRFVFDSYVPTGRSPYEAPVGRWLRFPDDPAAEVSVAFRRSVGISKLWPDGASGEPSSAADNPLVAHLERHPPDPDETWTVPIALARELCARIPFLLIDPASGVPQLSPPAAGLRPGSVVVFPPQQDAFGIEGAGADLVDGQPPADATTENAIGRFELTAKPDESRYQGEVEVVELVNELGDSTGWFEVTPVSPDPDEVVLAEPYGLDEHQRDVEKQVREWCSRLALPEALTEDLALAALRHDEGKRNNNFQHALRHRRCPDGTYVVDESANDVGKSALARRDWRWVQRQSGVPHGWRHEADSVARFEAARAAGEVSPHDPAMVRHLILTHHGSFRPFGPLLDGPDAPPLQDPTTDEWATRVDEFNELVRTYGPYSLALAEAIVRLADWAASRRLA
ncbi:CRISPR-associated endonuclease/helicase Cas3 [Barrientosiimonas humi]|uniref:CRISPR-associated endonuclease/helicase Cas3 n=1 Tax=Barrientosiimonas humi TaxID=999931 RepID=A0A542XG13_9MICO|nr:CRISPR-associated endonuclease/helicase Cas3 [Barrientosiimonas humi]CAG7570813.1 hypothetical protein BH39T_PBIAJDOK_00048 [Barrientosiimonas humi]